MKESTLSSISCYVDPFLKDLPSFKEINKNIHKLSIIDSYTTNSKFPLLVLTTKENLNFLDLESRQYHIFLFEDYKLDLFGAQNQSSSQKIIELDVNCTWSNFSQLLDFYYGSHLEEYDFKNIQLSNKSLKKLEKSISELNLALIKSDSVSRNIRDHITGLISLEESIFCAVTFAQAKQELKNFMLTYLKAEKLDAVFKFLLPNEVEDDHFKLSSYILPLYQNEELNSFFAINYENLIEGETEVETEQLDLIFYKIYQFLSDYLNKDIVPNQYSINNSDQIWDETLASIPYPVALLKENGELIKHNAHFINLNLRAHDCLKLKHRQKVQLEQGAFDVFRRDDLIEGEAHSHFFFHHSQHLEVAFTPSNEELGIVSSSIAHELNNPLAGVLAAVEVFLIDDEMDEDQVNDLLEIQKGALRCKQLVETFLGFSKARPEKLNISTGINAESIKVSLDQAMDLIRFRLIENNIKLDFNYIKEESYREAINGSVFSMIFYLVFGDIITAFSHYLLISEKDLSKTISMKITEERNRFTFSFEDKFLEEASFQKSKLIYHLLDLENHELNFSEHSLEIKPKKQLLL
jgi:signal transduction histidine kinase